ncbi:MAG: hypothetical protein J0I29_14025 [Rhizobiales bacterium]|nr:hypothetical protein [Hyphomicrobiales bacterium]
MATGEGANDWSDEDEQPGDGGPAEAARFVSRQAGELAQLSRIHGHDMLAYLLDMAKLEADEIARRDLTSKL